MTPIQLLNALVKEHEITTRQLGRLLGIDHACAWRILKGERGITVKHARTLAKRFSLRPAAFLDLGEGDHEG